MANKLTKTYRFVCVVRLKGEKKIRYYYHDLVVESWMHNPDTLLEYWDSFVSNKHSVLVKIGFGGGGSVPTNLSLSSTAEFHLLLVQEISMVTYPIG